VKNLNLFYSGGSGGFLLLHLLLLSGRYHVMFKNDISMDTALHGQWKITDHDSWKKTETWPDNEKTFHSDSKLTKIYFYCNPESVWPPGHIDYQGNFGEYSNYNIGLYTDYSSQVLLAKYKRALYFGKTDIIRNQKFHALREISKSWQQHYNNIKDPSWPKCKSFRKINQLPTAVKQELMDDPYTQSFLDFEYHCDYQGQEVFLGILPFLQSADVTVKLQDLVNHTEHILREIFEIDHINDQQKNLVEHWKTLHTQEMLTTLGIQQPDR
jgi:hypothetical protein